MQITDEMVKAAIEAAEWIIIEEDMRAALEAALRVRPKCDSDLLMRLRGEALGITAEVGVPAPITNVAAACIEDLTEALKPFVIVCGDEPWDDKEIVSASFPIGTFQRARAALERWGLKYEGKS